MSAPQADLPPATVECRLHRGCGCRAHPAEQCRLSTFFNGKLKDDSRPEPSARASSGYPPGLSVLAQCDHELRTMAAIPEALPA